MTETSTTTLTPRQAEVLAYLVDYIAANGYGPTVREISQAFKFRSPVAAQCHLKSLRKKGYVTWMAGSSRSIRLTGAQG